MDKLTKSLLAGTIAGLLVLTIYVLNGGATTIIEQTLGGGGPDFRAYPYLTVGDVTTYSGAMSLRQASSTVCSFQSPNATSTLVRGTAIFTVASTSAIDVFLAKGATINATTTNLGFGTIAANAQGALVASTTQTTSDDALNPNYIFGPSQYLNVNVKGAINGADTAGTGFVPEGSCTASFQVL